MRNLLIVVLGLILVSCGGKQSEESASGQWDMDASGMKADDNTGDWLIIHELSDSDKIHPQVSHGADATYIEEKIFESLLTQNKHTLEMIPQLAVTMPDISDDKLEYTFELRQDVYFSDGTPLTAHDVVFSLKALRNPFADSASLRNYFNNLAKAELVDGDPYKVRFICSDVYFKHDLFIGGLKIYPRHYYDPDNILEQYTFEELNMLIDDVADKDPEQFAELPAYKFAEFWNSKDLGRSPMGSGPYLLTEWVTDDRLVLERDPNYWGDKAGIANRGYAAKQIHKTVKDFDAALIGLKSGELDIIYSLPQDKFQMKTNSRKFVDNFNKELFYIPSYSYIGWNSKNPIFQSKMIRRAMTHLCDREQIIEVLYFGNAMVAKSNVYFKRPEYNDNIEPWEFNPDLAREILKSEGWEDTDGDGILDKMFNGEKVPFEFTFLTNNGNEYRKQTGLIMAEELRKVGIKADVQTLEWSVFLNTVRDQVYDAVILGWVTSVTDTDPYQIFHSSQAVGRGSNYVSFIHERGDELIELNRKEFDPEIRKEYMMEFQEILHEEQPYTFTYIPTSNIVYHKRFRGVTVFPVRPGYDPLEWWVPVMYQKYSK